MNGNEILKYQLEKISDKKRAEIVRGVWAEKLESDLASFNLEPYQKTAIENEVLLVLVELETISDLEENIIRGADLNAQTASPIDKIIKNNILNNFENQTQPPKPDQPRSRIAPVGFEEAILNQARAMRVATPPPSNLPTAPEHDIHDYKQGADPYREPIE